MKSELNKYRQYTISDYLFNTNKFKDYLLFCQKHNLKKEKKYIMEYLNRTISIKIKDNGGNKLLSELKNLCILTIIYSDFEIELLFDLDCFNPEMQKNIFNDIKNYLNNNNDVNNEEIKLYLNYKYNYGILKLQNQNFKYINKVKDNILLEGEIKESLEKLKNYININKDNFYDKSEKEQLLLLKIIYELCIYFYYKNDEKVCYYLKILIDFNNIFIENYKIELNTKLNKLFYFDIEEVKYLYKYINKNNEKNKNKNNEIKINYNNDLSGHVNNNFFVIENIINYNNIIDEDYIKYKNEIEKTNNDYIEKLNLNNENCLNACESSNKNCTNSLLHCLKIIEFLIDITLENFSNYKIGINFINSLKSKADFKIKNNINKKEDNDLKYINKEIIYYDIMFQLIENMINNEEKLHVSFFKNLSEFITNNNLTGNLKLSGLIHSNMINFSRNLKTLYKYFEKFIEFFKEKQKTTPPIYKQDTINQIDFITKIVQIFYIILDTKKKLNFPLDKEITINIQQELHIELINIFLYWLNCEENIKEDDKKKESKNIKKNLKYNPSINIIFILIESLKNLEFLKILKIIISNVLDFFVQKKRLNDSENVPDILESIYETNPNIFKINTLLDGVLRNIKVILDEQTYFINFKINFMESQNREKYTFNKDLINYYIKILFNLEIKIEDKINKYESIQKINEINDINNNKDLNNKNKNEIKNKENEYFTDILNSKKNMFLLSFYYIMELNIKNDKEIKKAIINGIDYLQFNIYKFKIAYMDIDLMSNDISKIKKNYENFKLLINQDILYQLILCFIKQKRFLESIILLQYTEKFNKVEAYKLLQNICEKNDIINIESLKYIWKMVIFEYLSNFYYKNNYYDGLEKIKCLIKRVSNHQYFKGHPLRKNFKIVNFFNFLDYLNNIKYNC